VSSFLGNRYMNLFLFKETHFFGFIQFFSLFAQLCYLVAHPVGDATQYILWECKSEVDLKRGEINKREAEQMNRSCAWFEKHYAGCSVKNILVHPSNYVPSATAFTHNVEVMRAQELKHIVQAVREFYKSFETQDFHDLSPVHIQKLVDSHHLSTSTVLSNYTRILRDMR
ncbi:MAG: hypothetical protein WCD86_18950, partial [Ktedonobacteraceae bacterium]